MSPGALAAARPADRVSARVGARRRGGERSATRALVKRRAVA